MTSVSVFPVELGEVKTPFPDALGKNGHDGCLEDSESLGSRRAPEGCLTHCPLPRETQKRLTGS